MFSGLVEEIGQIKTLTKTPAYLGIEITANSSIEDAKIGDSIAVNGVCLTVTELTKDSFWINAIPETLTKTNLGELTLGSFVNLERSLAMNARIGGHYVQGHVDGVCQLKNLDKQEAVIGHFSLPKGFNQYFIPKGYIALDGMSLTIVDVFKDSFTIAFIPHTITHTIVQHYQPEQNINFEVDVIAKYVERILTQRELQHA